MRTAFVAMLLVAAVISGEWVWARDVGVAIGEEDAGRQIAIDEGQVLTVSLPAQPGTGYSWQVATLDEDAGLVAIGKPQFKKVGKVLPGGIEQQVFRFRATDAGAVHLELQYKRPWEKDSPPAKVYSVDVEIR